MAQLLCRKMENELGIYKRSYEGLKEADGSVTRNVSSNVKTAMPYLRISGVSVVHNNYLHLLFQLKMEEYKIRYGSVSIKQLYHATCKSNVDSIITSNLDWRRVSRSKFGKGVSFSDNPDYANFHSNLNNGCERAFIVADVLVNNICQGRHTMTVPPDGIDTAMGNRTVYVKFNDNEFLPKYVIFYDAPDRSKSRYYLRRRHF